MVLLYGFRPAMGTKEVVSYGDPAVSYLERDDDLQAKDLRFLFDNEVVAYVIRGRITDNVRRLLLDYVQAHQNEAVNYTNDVVGEDGEVVQMDYGVSRIGPALNVVYGNQANREDLLQQYFAEAKSVRAQIYQALDGQVNPVDQLIKDLENCGFVTSVHKIQGNSCMTGIIRIDEPGVTPMAERPHIDTVRDDDLGLQIVGQFSMIGYLSVPESGGELVVHDYKGPIKIDDGEQKGIEQTLRLGNKIVIKLRPGDVALLNTRYPHATTTFTEGKRVAIQAFVGYTADDELIVWN